MHFEDPLVKPSTPPLDEGKTKDRAFSEDQGAAQFEAMRCQDLSVVLDKKLVIKNLNLSIPSGQWLSVVGPNGAGKSTFLRALAGLQSHQGEVFLKGQALQAWEPKIKSQQLTWMGQEGAFVDDLRALDVVRLGRLPYQKSWSWGSDGQDEQIRSAMELTQTWHLKDHAMASLSAGQVQRVLLARAFCTKSEVLLLDEPTKALDPPFQAQWISWMRALVAQGVTVVTVLHDLNIALSAQNMLILKDGEMAHWGATTSPELHRAIESTFAGCVEVLELGETLYKGATPTHQVVLRPPLGLRAL